jgi:hypothetical protein
MKQPAVANLLHFATVACQQAQTNEDFKAIFGMLQLLHKNLPEAIGVDLLDRPGVWELRPVEELRAMQDLAEILVHGRVLGVFTTSSTAYLISML